MGHAFDFAKSAQSSYQQMARQKEAAKQEKQKEEAENKYLKKVTGQDFEGATAKERQAAYESFLKKEEKTNEFNEKMERYKKYGFSDYLQGGEQSGMPGQQQNDQGSFSDQINRPGTQTAEGNMDLGEIKLKTDLPNRKVPDKMIFDAEMMGDHNLAQQLKEHNKSLDTQKHHQENLDFKKSKETPEHKRDTAMAAQQAKADTDYNTQLQQSAGLAHIKTKTLTDLEKLNEKGVTGKPYEKLLEKAGLVNLTSEGRREFAADVKHMITDIRSILGGQFSNFEFQTILNAYPSADFSQGANRAIINNLKEFQDIKNKEIEFANEIKKNNGGKIPEDYQSLVNKKVTEYANDKVPSIKANMRKVLHEEYGIPDGNYLMFDNNGEPLNVPEEMLDHYMELGATLP
jgi:hypothetical protein